MATTPLSSNLAAPLAPPLTHSSRNPDQRGMYLPPDEAARTQLPRGSDQGGMYMPPDERRPVPHGPPRGNEPGMWSSPYDESGRQTLPARGNGQGLPLLPHGSSRPITSGGPEHGMMWPSNQAMPIQPRVPERGGIFLTSDDHALAKTVEGYHRPDARDVNVRPLFILVREIIDRCTAVEGASLQANKKREATREGTFSLNGLQEVPELPLIVDRISSEITSRLLGGVDAHNTTLSVLNMLQHFSWEAKVVLAMAAFALNYGDFWLLVQIYNKNPLAKSMAIIKRLPMVMEHEGGLNQQFEATNNLISAMFETTQCMVEFGDLPTNYISHEDPEVKAALSHFPIAVYWIIRSSVAVSAHITTISSSGAEYAAATSQSWELSNWTHKLKNISNHLREKLSRLHRLIGEKRDIDAYKMIQKILYKPMHVDNMEVLKALIPSDDVPLLDCQNKRRVHLEVLRNRTVLLLISDLNITQEELSVLELSNSEAKVHHQYEMVWIPVVEHTQWTDAMQVKLESMQASMPWYSVHHPTMISGAVIKFIRDDWHFRGKPILVVLDQFGKVISPNAIHMMWIWQNHAFPFTSTREEDLWAQESWRLELLVDNMDQKITDWIKADKYIFVYGGDDLEWIRRFTREAHAVARALDVQVEMVYVGRSHNKDVVRKVTEAINNEQLSHCWHDLTMIWYFWTRIESMIYSKFQTRRVHDDGDVILQEIQRLHSHDKSHGGWAILARGSRIVVHGHGKIALVTLQELELWKQKAVQDGFDAGYGFHYQELHRKEFPCHRIEFPSNIKVPSHMLCPDCRRHMKNYNSFICCHEDDMIGSDQFTPAVQAEG